VQSVVQLDTRLQKTEETQDAASHDLQDVHTTVAINWSIEPDAAPQLYQTIGTIEQIPRRARRRLTKRRDRRRAKCPWDPYCPRRALARQHRAQRAQARTNFSEALGVFCAVHY
jgi:hypothetical protein